MRLLRTSTMVVEEFFAEQVPEYVILSHTWGEEEVTLQDMRSDKAFEKKGYSKVKGCCEKALSDGFDFCWIDTCCIDKTSSAELSEAINSMYKWYAASAICYVYLPDVTESFGALFPNEITRYRNFDSARWFKRGWTLQELIAPAIVEFYDGNWKLIGTRLSLRNQIARNTGIDRGVFEGRRTSSYNVAVRMSWASRRETTRIEDEAYFLLGLFGVNMPLLYGEGRQAFRRLQEEILRVEEDYTLFVWNTTIPNNWDSAYPTDNHYSTNVGGMLARKPSDFGEFVAKTVLPSSWHDHWLPDRLSVDPFAYLPESEDHLPPYLTSRGVRLSLPLTRGEKERDYWACITMLSTQWNEWHMLCMPLQRVEGTDDRYARVLGIPPVLVPKTSIRNFQRQTIYVDQPIHYEVSVRHTRIQPALNTFGVDWTPDFVNVETRTIHEELVESSAPDMLSLFELLNSLGAAGNKLSNYGADLSPLYELAEKLRPASKTSLKHLTMRSDLSTCYVTRRNTYTWLAFRVGVLHLAFVVSFNIEDNGPWCSVWPIDADLFENVQTDPDQAFVPLIQQNSNGARSDCVVLDVEAIGSSPMVHPLCRGGMMEWRELFLWRKLMHAKSPALYQVVEYRKWTAYGLIFLAHYMFEYGEAHFQSLLVDLKDTWADLPGVTGHTPFPFSFSEADIERIKLNSEGAVAGTELVAALKERIGDLWPEKGFIEHERYVDCKAALDEVRDQILEQVAESNEEKDEYKQYWPLE